MNIGRLMVFMLPLQRLKVPVKVFEGNRSLSPYGIISELIMVVVSIRK